MLRCARKLRVRMPAHQWLHPQSGRQAGRLACPAPEGHGTATCLAEVERDAAGALRVKGVEGAAGALEEHAHCHELGQAQRAGPARVEPEPGVGLYSECTMASRSCPGTQQAWHAGRVFQRGATARAWWGGHHTRMRWECFCLGKARWGCPQRALVLFHSHRPGAHRSGSNDLKRASKAGPSSRYPACATAFAASALSREPAGQMATGLATL